MKQITLSGDKQKIWDLYDSLLMKDVEPKPKRIDGGQCIVITVKEISVEEADAILADDITICD